MTAKRDTENMDASRPTVEDLKAQAEAEQPDELTDAIRTNRCPRCGSPRYKVVSSPSLVQYVKCDYCGHGFKIVK